MVDCLLALFSQEEKGTLKTDFIVNNLKGGTLPRRRNCVLILIIYFCFILCFCLLNLFCLFYCVWM